MQKKTDVWATIKKFRRIPPEEKVATNDHMPELRSSYRVGHSSATAGFTLKTARHLHDKGEVPNKNNADHDRGYAAGLIVRKKEHPGVPPVA